MENQKTYIWTWNDGEDLPWFGALEAGSKSEATCKAETMIKKLIESQGHDWPSDGGYLHLQEHKGEFTSMTAYL